MQYPSMWYIVACFVVIYSVKYFCLLSHKKESVQRLLFHILILFLSPLYTSNVASVYKMLEVQKFCEFMLYNGSANIYTKTLFVYTIWKLSNFKKKLWEKKCQCLLKMYLLLNKDVLHCSKVTVKTLTLLQKNRNVLFIKECIKNASKCPQKY